MSAVGTLSIIPRMLPPEEALSAAGVRLDTAMNSLRLGVDALWCANGAAEVSRWLDVIERAADKADRAAASLERRAAAAGALLDSVASPH